jgi:gliding motility-associated-like protein
MNGSVLINVLANDVIRGPLVSYEIVEYPRYGNAYREGDDIRYDADPGFCGVDNFVYELCNQYGCDTALVTTLTLCDEIIIYSGFSPNFDDVNETFTVEGIEQFPGNRMEVFNRYGNLVFEMDEYDNSWDGTYFDGDELPEGTYFYVFDDGKGRTYTGYVYLKR